MVIPRSNSRAFESIDTPTPTIPVSRIKASVRVVLPWSTCAIIAMFLISISCPRLPQAGQAIKTQFLSFLKSSSSVRKLFCRQNSRLSGQRLVCRAVKVFYRYGAVIYGNRLRRNPVSDESSFRPAIGYRSGNKGCQIYKCSRTATVTCQEKDGIFLTVRVHISVVELVY